VLFESAIFIEHDSRLDEITEFIKNNLTEKLSLELICKRFLMSKNSLYAAFKEHLGTTVAEYITDARLERAKAMLRDTAAPVYEIAESVGVNNYTYFCKLFKKKEGVSPMEYRKASR
jgi:two-component system response regulator YesN